MARHCYLTVDLEDYKYNVMQRMSVACPSSDAGQPPRGVDKILSVLNNAPGSKNITFFTTGQVARDNPALIKRLSNEGHEIACHTDTHRYLNEFKDEEEFKKDLLKARDTLRGCSGREITGFRAPKFSVGGDHLRMYEILGECGFIYDCSISRNEKRNGVEEYERIKTSKGALYSFPQYYYLFKPLMVIGGTWFRLLPFFIIRRLMRKASDDGYAPIVYLHPSDMDDELKAVPASEMKGLGCISRLKWRFWQARLLWGRKGAAKKLEALLREFPNKGTMSQSLPNSAEIVKERN